MFRSFISAFAIMFLSFATVQAVDVTLNSSIDISTVGAVAKYEVRVKANTGTVLPVLDAATNDPNGDGAVELVPAGPGFNSASTSMALFLTGQSLGSFTLEARSIDSNGNGSGWTLQSVIYVAPESPIITVSAVYDVFSIGTFTDFAILDKRQLLA